MNLVSVIIPYYNNKFFLLKAVKSILNQSYHNFEIVIVYDNSDITDLYFVKNIVKLDKRIFLIRNLKNIGAGLSRNKGISISRGYYIAFLDSDDLWVSNKLKLHLQFMRDHNADFSFTSYDIINSEGKKIGNRKADFLLKYDDLKRSCDIGLSTVIMKKKLFNNFLKFPNLRTKEDYVLWLKLAKKKVGLHGLNIPLTKRRVVKNSLSSNVKQKILDAFLVYRKYLKYNLILSLWSVIVLSVNYVIKKYQ